METDRLTDRKQEGKGRKKELTTRKRYATDHQWRAERRQKKTREAGRNPPAGSGLQKNPGSTEMVWKGGRESVGWLEGWGRRVVWWMKRWRLAGATAEEEEE